MSAAGAIAVMAGNNAKAPACASTCLSTPLELAIVVIFIALAIACLAGILWRIKKQ